MTDSLNPPPQPTITRRMAALTALQDIARHRRRDAYSNTSFVQLKHKPNKG